MVHCFVRHFDEKRKISRMQKKIQTRKWSQVAQENRSRVTDDTARNGAASDTTVKSGLYGAVLDCNGIRSFIRRTTMHARVREDHFL